MCVYEPDIVLQSVNATGNLASLTLWIFEVARSLLLFIIIMYVTVVNMQSKGKMI